MTPDEGNATPEPQDTEPTQGTDGGAAEEEDAAHDDRRKHRRFAIQDCAVQHRKAGLLARFQSFSEEQSPLVNLSLGGIQFLTNAALRVDDTIHIRAHLPKGEEPLDLKGAIVWQGAGNDEYESRVGVLFSKASEETWRRLRVVERAYSLD